MIGYPPVLNEGDIAPEDAIDAATVRIEAERESVCTTCKGEKRVLKRGYVFYTTRLVTCPTCHGTGRR